MSERKFVKKKNNENGLNGVNLNIYAKIIEEIRFLFLFEDFRLRKWVHTLKININALPQH